MGKVRFVNNKLKLCCPIAILSGQCLLRESKGLGRGKLGLFTCDVTRGSSSLGYRGQCPVLSDMLTTTEGLCRISVI